MGNLVQTLFLGSKAEAFKSSDVDGAALPTECLDNRKNELSEGRTEIYYRNTVIDVIIDRL